MKKLHFLSLAILSGLLLIPGAASSQHPTLAFSLKQAQDYAYENNYDLKNSAKDVEIARKLVSQNTAIGLPQVNAGADYMYYLELPTTLIPGEFLGQQEPIEVQFGSPYNFTFKATATQLLYSGQYLVGVQTAKSYLETVRQKMVSDQMNVRDLVTEAYIGLLIVRENILILDSTYKTISKMVDEAKEVYNNGLIEDIDVEQLELNKSNLEATLINTQNQGLYAYNYLKFVIGIQGDQEISLTDSLGFFLVNLAKDYLMNQPFDFNYNIDYKMLQKQEHLVYMQYKLSKTAYQPTLSTYLSFSENAQRAYWNFFQGYQPWFETAIWGVSLAIPIWSSGNRKYAVDQARLNVEKMKISDTKMKEGLSLQVETAKSDFNNSYLVFVNKKKGLDSAKKIYDKTVAKYTQGMSSSTDLNQRYNQFLASESDYIQSMYVLLKSRIKLYKLLEKV
ncbi:MAG TPA: TolC family protein [Bacteroidales bacterium]|nr:TolC family protein [Bacteroidales bacterium]